MSDQGLWSTVQPLSLIGLRVAAVYVFLIVIVRLAGKREVGQLSPMEFLCVLLLSETVSPALTGGDHSLPAALVAAVTLMSLSVLVNVIAFRYRWFEELMEGRPALLIRSGRVNSRVMRTERITKRELDAALRRQGVASVAKVAKAYVETSGDITVLKRDV